SAGSFIVDLGWTSGRSGFREGPSGTSTVFKRQSSEHKLGAKQTGEEAGARCAEGQLDWLASSSCEPQGTTASAADLPRLTGDCSRRRSRERPLIASPLKTF